MRKVKKSKTFKLDNLKSFHEIRKETQDNAKALEKLKESMPKMKAHKVGKRTVIELPASFTDVEARNYIDNKFGKANIV